MKKKTVILAIILLIIVLIVFGLFKKKEGNNLDREIKYVNNSFNLNLIKTVNYNNQENYLISPYSVEVALNLLKEGANGNTLKEIEEVIGNRDINDISIKDRVSVANAAFIKNDYKEYILKNYYRTLKDKYNSEILYDDFTSPKVINDWVNDKTNGMIKEILSDVNKDFVLGLANALAIDVEWYDAFECTSTVKQKFTKYDGTKMDTEMMHKTLEYGDYTYLSNEEAIGVIIPYKTYNSKTGEEVFTDGNQLEFVAILPKDNLHNYINNLTEDKLDKLFETSREVSDNFEIRLSLPRFKYDYNLEDFADVLNILGIKDAFDDNNADFTKIMSRSSEIPNLYVGEAIHKTHIDLNEKGTKAAAITYFGMYKATAMPKEPEYVEVTLDRPFMYIIRDSKTKEMLFFGTVYEPNIWTGSTCDE